MECRMERRKIRTGRNETALQQLFPRIPHLKISEKIWKFYFRRNGCLIKETQEFYEEYQATGIKKKPSIVS
jgi:hypothetical protein